MSILTKLCNQIFIVFIVSDGVYKFQNVLMNHSLMNRNFCGKSSFHPVIFQHMFRQYLTGKYFFCFNIFNLVNLKTFSFTLSNKFSYLPCCLFSYCFCSCSYLCGFLLNDNLPSLSGRFAFRQFFH